MKSHSLKALKFFIVFICSGMLFHSCIFKISTLSGPDSVEIGEVIELKITGESVSDFTPPVLNSCDSSLILQIPRNWYVVSSRAVYYLPEGVTTMYTNATTEVPSLDTVTLSENCVYKSLYKAEDGYKVVVLTADDNPRREEFQIEVYVSIQTDTSLFMENPAIIKAASGFDANSVWEYNDPPDIFDFADITSSNYIHSIAINE